MREYLKIIGKWSTNKALVPASLGDFSQLLPILVEVCVDRRDDIIGEVVDAIGPGGEGVVHF